MPTYEGVILDEGGAVYNVNAYASVHDAVAAAVAAGRGTVYFPPGVYTITAPITVDGKQDIKFIGAGPNATQLVQDASNTDGVFVITDDGSVPPVRITIQGFWIGAFPNASYASSGYGIDVRSTVSAPASVIVVRDIELMNVPYPFRIQHVHQSIFENIRILHTEPNVVKGTLFVVNKCISIRLRDCNAVLPTGSAGKYPQSALLIYDDCDTILVADCELGDSQGPGVVLDGATTTGPRLVRLDNVFVERCNDAGIVVRTGQSIRLEGCHSAVNQGVGYAVTGGRSVSIINSLALQNDLHGYYLSGTESKSVIGCRAANNGQGNAGSYSGCFLEVGTEDAQVVNTRLGGTLFPSSQNTQGYGLRVGNNSSYVIATSNDLRKNTVSNLDIVSPNSTILTDNNLQ